MAHHRVHQFDIPKHQFTVMIAKGLFITLLAYFVAADVSIAWFDVESQVFTHTICLSKIKGMSFRITDEVQIYYLTTVIHLATWKFSCCNKSKFFHPVSVIYRMMTLSDWQGEIKSTTASINSFCSMPKKGMVITYH